MRIPWLALVGLLLLLPSLYAEKWKMQYFYDEDRSALTFTDIKFLTAKTGIASGILSKAGSDKPQGVFLVTKDGGEHWDLNQFSELPLVMQFVNESTGFVVTNRGLWRTDERGLVWKKIKSQDGLRHVYFNTPETGVVVGAAKTLLLTSDGGKTWTKPEELKKVTSNPQYTAFNWIAFISKERGIILGSSQPPRRTAMRAPAWADPEAAKLDRQWPTLTVTMETRDAGKTWTPQTAPVFGQIARLAFFNTDSMYGLSIMQYEHAFDVPSELYLFNWRTGKSESAFKSKQRVITDVQFTGPTEAYAATIERPGTMANAPTAGKLKIMTTQGLRTWLDMPVDYRATGKNAILSVVDKQHAWVALDSGMILRLEP